MRAPEEHRAHLAKRDYPLGCSSDVFPAEELKFLRRYGYWAEALVNGVISPVTDAQRRLVEVHNGKAGAITLNERAWMRLVERSCWEKDVREAPHYELVDKSEQWFSRRDWNRLPEH
jgi:uncharacterized protein YifE (UPF0438 family)